MKRGKKYSNLVKEYDLRKDRSYDVEEATELLPKTSLGKADATVECAAKINYKSLQNVRGNISLPHGNGKKVRIAVFAKGDDQLKAKESGADVVGDVDLVEKVKEGFLDFDVAVATPEMMKDVGKLGPILGRKGLMPKPKAGTVTTDVAKTIDELRAGRIEYKADKTGVVHLGIGKASFSPEKIKENLAAVYSTIVKDKPSDAKGEYITSLFITTTHGPSLKVNPKSIKA